jgi:glycosyltransferase involved in cell wall biosynthesis
MSQQVHKAPVSVIIPCFRSTDTLQRAVLSVGQQSFIPAEVILIDDCSPDETPVMMQKIADQYTPGWIRIVLLKSNMGAASARNAGWAIATQPYIAFLDSDDAWHPEKIRLQLDYMRSHPDTVLCGHAHKILSSPVIPDWSLRLAKSDPKVMRITKLNLLLSNRFVTPSAMIKRDIPQRFEERQRYMEDHMLWLNISCSGAVIERLPLPLAAIYKRPYGQAGLSSHWWLMEQGDLGNYRRLFLKGYITRVQFLVFVAYSLVKFVRRLVLYNLLALRAK